jgi:ubiquinone/menaquinone biosynthesis C-methylase UbiE
VDLGCGTGNAALLAAGRGARVTGVDPAPRLLDVARARAAERGLDATFAHGEAGDLPLEDGEVDVVLSVFGVIFAPDPRARMLAIYEDANEDPDAFRTTSRYVVATAERHA